MSEPQVTTPGLVTALAHQPVTDADGRVSAYAVRTLASCPLPAVTQQLSPDHELDAEYDLTDLGSLGAGRPLLLQATHRVLTSEDESVIAHVPGPLAARPQVAGMVAWRRARGLSTGMTRFTGSEPELALLPMVSIVGLDTTLSDGRIGDLVDLAHATGSTVVIEGIRFATDIERAFALGADAVEGRVQPTGELEQGGLSAAELTCLELLTLLDEDPVDAEAVTGLVAADPNLTVGVLHLINSPVFALPRRIDSIRQATVMVGPRLLRAVATTALTRSGHSSTDELWLTLTRALACWELAGDDAGYTVGLLSAVADQRRVDPAWLATMAGLSGEATEALVQMRGPIGSALATIRAHELGDLSAVAQSGADPRDVSRAWLGSLPEALGIAVALSGGS